MAEKSSVSVVMPVYNEAATLAVVVARVLAQPCVLELIAVDDGSHDGSGALLAELAVTDSRIRLVSHPRNCGKGAALRTGFALAAGDIVLVQDADLEYTTDDYERLLAPILAGYADVVFGSRFLGGPGAHRVLYYWHYVGNRVLTFLSNVFTNINLTDMETGYKVFRREALQRFTVTEDRFGCEPEITAKVARLKLRIYEVPVAYYGRTYQEGKKIGWRDGLHAIWCILRYSLGR